MHDFRSRSSDNGSIGRTHSDIHIADDFDFIVVLVQNDRLGLNGLTYALGLYARAYDKKYG
jgi:hypothetical protein